MKMLDKNELEDILNKEGKAELVCEFCKNKYFINYEEIKSLIED
jgi:molecular chaperone Hsp33